MIDRADVKPGAKAILVKEATAEGRVCLDGHMFAFSQQHPLNLGETVTILSKPRKRDGINLVRVQRTDGRIGEVYYTHIHYAFDLVEGPPCDVHNDCKANAKLGKACKRASESASNP